MTSSRLKPGAIYTRIIRLLTLVQTPLLIGIAAKCNGLKPGQREFEMTIESMEKADGAAVDRGADGAPSTYNMIGVLLAAAGAVAFSLRAIFVNLAYEDMSDPVTLL